MARLITADVARSWLKPRPRNAHKGTSGRVLIIAGSRDMVGAAVLCASGAGRAGAGLIKLATVKSRQTAAIKRGPLEMTTLGLPEDANGFMNIRARHVLKKTIVEWKPDIIACGPGIGAGAGVKEIISWLLEKSGGRLVLDADGLNVLSKMPRQKIRTALILTPHAGEMARLLDSSSVSIQKKREESVKKAARHYHAVCLLKGPGTLVSDGHSVWKNTTGNPAMATGGMGDVLTGIIAALWAQGLSALQAAALGAYLHGLAGDLALKEFPERSMVASDLVGYLPKAFKKIWRTL